MSDAYIIDAVRTPRGIGQQGKGALAHMHPQLKPCARIVATANMGDDPTLMLNAPVLAARKVLAKAGLTLDDIDLWEINEAFAVVAEKFIRDLNLDCDKVNVSADRLRWGIPLARRARC